MSAQPFLFSDSTWIEVKDGNATGRYLFHRHYSYKPYKDGRDPALFAGPGEKAVLLTPDARALFVWRIERFRKDGQAGVNCAVFRNEGAGLASELIRDAMRIAWEKWPGERLYTCVNPRKVKSRNPGYCFIRAGWRKCGVTKHRKLLIFEAYPNGLERDQGREIADVHVPERLSEDRESDEALCATVG